MADDENKLRENIDFYYDESGKMVFTADYLLKRNYCCESGCRHCPYGYGKPKIGPNGKKKPSFEI